MKTMRSCKPFSSVVSLELENVVLSPYEVESILKPMPVDKAWLNNRKLTYEWSSRVGLTFITLCIQVPYHQHIKMQVFVQFLKKGDLPLVSNHQTISYSFRPAFKRLLSQLRYTLLLVTQGQISLLIFRTILVRYLTLVKPCLLWQKQSIWSIVASWSTN